MRAGAYDGVEAFAVVGAGSAARCRDGRPSTSRAATLNALSAVSISLDRRTLTQDMIETARQAVALMLDQFPACALRGCFEIGCQARSSSSRALASFKSIVSKPSVNQL